MADNRQKMKEKHYPIARLQRELGISSYSHLYGVVAGRRNPSQRLRARIAKLTGIDKAEIGATK
jgi:hypothetical protein